MIKEEAWVNDGMIVREFGGYEDRAEEGRRSAKESNMKNEFLLYARRVIRGLDVSLEKEKDRGEEVQNL